MFCHSLMDKNTAAAKFPLDWALDGESLSSLQGGLCCAAASFSIFNFPQFDCSGIPRKITTPWA